MPHSTNDGFHRLPNDFNLGIGRRLHIKAAEVDHIYGVQTFGYTIEEQPPPGNIDLNKAIALGVKPSKKYGLLKCGLSVPNDEGTDVVRPEQVLNKMYRPRKLALLADHRLVYRPMAQLCKDADLLVHEATLSKEDGLEVSPIDSFAGSCLLQKSLIIASFLVFTHIIVLLLENKNARS